MPYCQGLREQFSAEYLHFMIFLSYFFKMHEKFFSESFSYKVAVKIFRIDCVKVKTKKNVHLCQKHFFDIFRYVIKFFILVMLMYLACAFLAPKLNVSAVTCPIAGDYLIKSMSLMVPHKKACLTYQRKFALATIDTSECMFRVSSTESLCTDLTD